MTEPEFLDLADVLQIHDLQLAAYGGGQGVRDPGALESAVSQPEAAMLDIAVRKLDKLGVAALLRELARPR